MGLYRWGDSLLRVDGALAASENCCCGGDCTCCSEGQVGVAFTVRVVGVEETDYCNNQSPADNCRALNTDYVFNATAEQCQPMAPGATSCELYLEQAVGYQVCGLRNLRASLAVRWQPTGGNTGFGTWSIQFNLWGKDSLQQTVFIVTAAAEESRYGPASCRASRAADWRSLNICGQGTSFNVVFQPAA